MQQSASAGQSGGQQGGQGGNNGVSLYFSTATVRQIEQALNKQGYDAGNVDGLWDDSLGTALANYQQAQGLEPTGTLTTRSVAALGLGNSLQSLQGGGGGSQAGGVQSGQSGQQGATTISGQQQAGATSGQQGMATQSSGQQQAAANSAASGSAGQTGQDARSASNVETRTTEDGATLTIVKPQN